jgi:hypothetical protein
MISINFNYRNNKLLSIGKNLRDNQFYLLDININSLNDSNSIIKPLYLLPLKVEENERIVASCFHHFEKNHLSVILTQFRVLVLDLNKNEIIAAALIPNNIIFDAVQINPNIFI